MSTNSVPVSIGFIFPDGRIINTSGIGHCKCAMRYILENNLKENFRNSYLAEDDFLIEYLGVAKATHWRGTSYLFLPKGHGWYLNEIKTIYKNAGYTIKYCHKLINIDLQDNDFELIQSYNQTVWRQVTTEGKKIYTYNPNRKGD